MKEHSIVGAAAVSGLLRQELITRQVAFDLSVFAHHEKANQQRRLKRLATTARQMGYQLTPLSA